MGEEEAVKPLRLGINIDHIATVRNARGGEHPDPVRAALLAEKAGADGITAHLREDRRHIRDGDIAALKAQLRIPLNLEMAATAEMLTIACDTKPHAVCLVPEKREELTTEGGLDVRGHLAELTPYIEKLKAGSGARVSLFIDPDPAQLDAAKQAGAPVVELHTGRYADTEGEVQQAELRRLQQAAKHAEAIGLECHAGHGLNYANVAPVAAISPVVELNIGHFLMGEAMFVGLAESIQQMRILMQKARSA